MKRPERRFGPAVEIQRGSWEARLLELRKEGGRFALLVEPGEENRALADLVRPRLPGAVEVAARAAPLRISEAIPDLIAMEPLDAICVVGAGDRADARKAGFRLGTLAARLWIFVHRAVPPSGLVPTIGEKVARFLEIIDGAAFREGP